ncbi:flagellar assembly protein H [Massilia sp. IC2-477]|uniref:flagellar assembly protein FliH n=1 Tax=unclassified Massilia TaxID=2609279 RepID=UPI001D1136B7|nr:MULTISPECIES: flagellar assembly protein FliH [unclassified Massilia]MCC2954325.1 flagellar assembly protein H [Massilia sp. IC2-477]MCC2971764.1 flagellar assembly protein H [Massilia sp. IC2-476]
MKQFRPYHFPPLYQLTSALPKGATAGDGVGSAEEWQAALSDGYRQGQREGYEAGLDQGRADGFPVGQAEGLQRGIEEGRTLAAEGLEQLAKPIDAMLKSLKKLKTDMRAAQRKEVVELVGKIARQVIRAELALQPVQLLALVEEALSVMPPSRDTVEVFLNPEELRRVLELDPKRAKKWTLLPDPALEPGECRVRSGDNEVDAGCQGRLTAVMDQVREQLLDEEDGE